MSSSKNYVDQRFVRFALLFISGSGVVVCTIALYELLKPLNARNEHSVLLIPEVGYLLAFMTIAAAIASFILARKSVGWVRSATYYGIFIFVTPFASLGLAKIVHKLLYA